jgi:signal transduction histidine kinase/DNA-binding response OmpR family regulator
VAGEHKSYLHELYQAIPVGVFAIASDGRALLCNDAFRRLTCAGDVAHWIPRLDPAAQRLLVAEWEACAQHGTPILRDVPTVDTQGKAQWLRLRALRLLDGTIAGTLSDVTEIEEARIAAAAASRAKSEFLANMSHEIRTPLSAVVGMADLLWETDLDSVQRRFLGALREAGDHLLMLVNDLLDLSRVEVGELGLERHEMNLREQMDKAVDLVAARARAKRLEIHVRVAPDVPRFVVGDPLRLRQVLVNLLANAVKFTERGEIVLSVERAAGGGEVLRFAVRDTGIGIAADQLERIFRPFEQGETAAARRYGGAGLGLSISRRLVELMGGRMWVESEVGQGSTFGFELGLPFVTETTERPSLASLSLFDRRVLIVDENATGRLILREMLAGWGATVADVDTSVELVERLEGCTCDVVILAHSCVAEAAELVQKMRARFTPGELAIIVVVSELLPGDDERQRELGIQAVLLKPVRRRELFDALRGAFSRAEPREAKRPLAPPATAPRRILVADDSPDGRLLVQTLLRASGHEVDTVVDGRAAVEAAAHKHYDIILMDVTMPVLDGLGATREIRRHERQTGAVRTPILMLTAHGRPDDVTSSIDAGADGHLVKPLRKEALIAAIEDRVQAAPPASLERFRIEVTPTVAGLVPTFLANRDKDVRVARAALKRHDYHALWVLAHTMKGLGASYGFDGISEIGAMLEQAALAHDDAGGLRAIDALESYLGRVEYSVAS